MKVCITFPNSNLLVRSKALEAISSFLNFEGWDVYNENYRGFDSQDKFFTAILNEYRSVINDDRVTDVLIIGEGYGGIFAHLLGSIHSENTVLLNPEFETDDMSIQKLLKSTSRCSGDCLSILVDEHIDMNEHEMVMNVSTGLRLLGSDWDPVTVAHMVQDFAESHDISQQLIQ